MALPTSQPAPKILRGWTVARGIPEVGINGINSGIYELYGGVMRLAPHNDGACRILGKFGGLQSTLRRSIALKKQACRGLIHPRQCMAELTARGGAFPARIHRLMPGRECKNDVLARFTKYPLDDSHRPCRSCLVFSSMYSSVPGPSVAERAKRRRKGATPLLEALVQAQWHSHR